MNILSVGVLLFIRVPNIFYKLHADKMYVAYVKHIMYTIVKTSMSVCVLREVRIPMTSSQQNKIRIPSTSALTHFHYLSYLCVCK